MSHSGFNRVKALHWRTSDLGLRNFAPAPSAVEMARLRKALRMSQGSQGNTSENPDNALLPDVQMC